MKIEFLGYSNIKLSEQCKNTSNVGFIKLIPDEIKNNTTNHHILLADVSGSMGCHIKTLKERIKGIPSLIIYDKDQKNIINYKLI